MAACTFRVGTADTGNTPNASGAFTPAIDDLLIVFACETGSVDVNWTCTSSIGGFTFTQRAETSGSASTDRVQVFIADALVSSATSQTVTVENAADQGTGSIIFVYSVSGMTAAGAAALRQSKVLGTQTAGTPAITFDAAVLTGNPTLGFISNASAAPILTPPTGWTENASGDLSYTAPAQGGEVCHRDSGFTGTTVTWGSASATNWGGLIIELAASEEPPPPETGPIFMPGVCIYVLP